jgi:hypothetical protein
MRKEDFISKDIFEEIEEVGFVSNFIKGTYTEIKGVLYDLHIPTYSEVFAWFRNRHKIFACVKDESLQDGIIYFQFYFRYYMKTYLSSAFNSYEEAEKAALEHIMIHFKVMIQEKRAEIESKKEVIEFD